MNTPEEDVLREHAIEQIMQQIAQERASKNERELSRATLRRIAEMRLKNPQFGLAENKGGINE